MKAGVLAANPGSEGVTRGEVATAITMETGAVFSGLNVPYN